MSKRKRDLPTAPQPTAGHAAPLLPRLAPLSRLPVAVLGIVRELARHVLRRPVLGIAAVACTPDGRLVLIRRADTGTWALPGGTLDWGETLSTCLVRELREEAGVELRGSPEMVGVYSRPDRDVRFHAVTIVVRCSVDLPHAAPHNPLEITEVGLFERGALPSPLAMSMDDMLERALQNGPVVLE